MKKILKATAVFSLLLAMVGCSCTNPTSSTSSTTTKQTNSTHTTVNTTMTLEPTTSSNTSVNR